MCADFSQGYRLKVEIRLRTEQCTKSDKADGVAINDSDVDHGCFLCLGVSHYCFQFSFLSWWGLRAVAIEFLPSTSNLETQLSRRDSCTLHCNWHANSLPPEDCAFKEKFA